MNKKIIKTIEENRLHGNALKTATYLFDALREEDYESCMIELEELKFSVQRLKDLELKRKRKNMLADLVRDMQNRGINIGFASRSSFVPVSSKNAVEEYRKTTKIHKKRQQA